MIILWLYFEIVTRNFTITSRYRRVKFEAILKYYEWYLCQIMLLFVYTTTRKEFEIFTCRYFKLS